MPGRCSMPSAVLALPCGSRSMTRVFRPCSASAAATLTAVVVLPTPPFWLAIVNTRWRGGRGQLRPFAACSRRTARSASAPIGVSATAGPPTPRRRAASMFHVKHRRAAPLGCRIRRRRCSPSGTGFILVSCPLVPTGRSCRVPTSPAPRHDHGRGRIQIVHATSHHPYIDGTERRSSHAGARRPLPRSLALDRHHPSARSQQRQAPPRQLVQRRHRPGRRPRPSPPLLSHGSLFGPPTDHGRRPGPGRRRPRARKSARRRSGSMSVTPQVRPGQRQRNPGQPGSTTDVGNRSPASSSSPTAALLRMWRSHSRSTSPGPIRPRSTPAPGQDSAYSLGAVQAVAEDGRGGRVAPGRFDMFHVKHPPDPPPAAAHRTTSM